MRRRRSDYGAPGACDPSKGEQPMRPLRYSINVTLDGCCDHQVMIPDVECITISPTSWNEPMPCSLAG